MVDTENVPQPQQQQQQQDPAFQPPKMVIKQVIAEKVSGTVKWFNTKMGYGFIERNDNQEDIFVHETAIVRNNPHKAERSLGKGEAVEFAVVVGKRGYQASRVTGPRGEPVKGSPYAAKMPYGFYCQYYQRQGGGHGGEVAPWRGVRMWRRGPPPTQGGAQGDEWQEKAQPQWYFSRTFRRGAGGPGGLNRRGLWRPRNNYQGQCGAVGANEQYGREILGAGAGRGAQAEARQASQRHHQ